MIDVSRESGVRPDPQVHLPTACPFDISRCLIAWPGYCRVAFGMWCTCLQRRALQFLSARI
jgi:hypothetical protein